MPLHPDISLKSSARCRFSHQILFIDAKVKDQIITVYRKDINIFLCPAVFDQTRGQNFSEE